MPNPNPNPNAINISRQCSMNIISDNSVVHVHVYCTCGRDGGEQVVGEWAA